MIPLILLACTFFPDDKAPPESSSDDTGLADSGDSKPEDSDDTAPPDPTGWPRQVFAPYVDATAYPTPKLADIHEAARVRYFTLGFIVDETGTECAATWGTYYPVLDGPSAWEDGVEYTLYSHIERLRAAGGDVMVSFGGAANTELAAACPDVATLATQYALVIDTLALTHVDFDIEGPALFDVGPGSATERRAQAIAQVQQSMDEAGRPLRVWLTLPILPSGLTVEGLTVLRDTLREGVKLSGVNAMTMNYGDGAAPDPEGQMGQYGVDAITAMHGQLSTVYAERGESLSDAELWGMIGTTPMIGRNDVSSELFTLADAGQTLAFVQSEGVGLLSMWSINRDHGCPEQSAAQPDCSSNPEQTGDWAYSGVFGDL